ncbi:MAG TPA: hypothetical protein VEI04_11885 [Syntrophobacteria bacterium]|nr:hypothetical protein [Syntrophobacteria bacterium]
MVDLLLKALVDTWQVTPRVLIVMFLSLYGSQVLIELGVFDKLAFIGRPLAKLARLPAEAGLTFVTSLGSVVAGNAMLARLHAEGKLDGGETFLIALLNSTPIYIRESFTYQLPVMLPLLGLKVGGVYFAAFLAAGVVRVLFVIIAGRLCYARPARSGLEAQPKVAAAAEGGRPRLRAALVDGFTRQKRILLRVCATFVVITFLIFVLTNSGLISRVVPYVKPLTDLFDLPPSCVVPLGAYILSPLVGATSIGAMLRDGLLNEWQGIVACLLGSILMLPVFTLRFSFPRYAAIFGVDLGSKILATSTVLGMLTRAVFLVIFLVMR